MGPASRTWFIMAASFSVSDLGSNVGATVGPPEIVGVGVIVDV